MRDFRLFHIRDDAAGPDLVVEAIHDERGYRAIRRALARQYDIGWTQPDIQVVDVDLAGDRRLILHHRVVNGMLLEQRDALSVLEHLANLWSYGVVLREIDATSEAVLSEHAMAPKQAT
jgi:spore cortex formation protein SpoVR/YcgB (stage V sporulation)